MVIDSSFYMRLALEEAWKYQGLTYPNPAVGCCVVGEFGEILALEAHKKAGAPHAEVNALQQAYYKLTADETILHLELSDEIHTYLLEHHKNIFQKTTLYTTLEPCAHVGKTPSCASLITQLGIHKVYVGSKDSNRVAKNGNTLLEQAGILVENGILKESCDALLFPFQKTLEERFVFFKWAQRLNATTDDGIISSQASRKNVHAMRNVCDLLVIGGETVRKDRPTLDARLVGGKAPDVLIFSRQKEFDTTIALFNVAGRKVFIADNFSKLENYKNIMIEGGAQMYACTTEIVDYYLVYIAPSFGGKHAFGAVKRNFEILNVAKEDKDIIMWMK